MHHWAKGLGSRPHPRYNGLSSAAMEHGEQTSASSVESRWLLKALREAADEIESQVFGLSEEQLRRRPEDEEWSLKETLLHLRDAEEVYLQWLPLIVRCDGAELPEIDIEDYPAERDYQSADLYNALMAFGGLRRETTHILWALAPDEWERGGLHPYRGRLTVLQVARDMNEHDLEHLWQMCRLRRQVEEEETEGPQRRGGAP